MSMNSGLWCNEKGGGPGNPWIVSLCHLSSMTVVLREQEKNWPCYECNRRFISSEQLQQHLNSHDEKLDVFSRYDNGEGFKNLVCRGPDSFQYCLPTNGCLCVCLCRRVTR